MNATRLSLRRASTAALRCASELRSAPTCASARAAARRPAHAATRQRRCYAAQSYQSYTLPSNAGSSSFTPPPRAKNSEEEIAMPAVNDTMPPKGAPQGVPGTGNIEASTTLEHGATQGQAPGTQATTESTAPTTPSASPSSSTTSQPPKSTSTSTSASTSTSTSTPTSTLSPAASSAQTSTQTAAPKPAAAKRPRPKLRARKAPMKLTTAAVEQLRMMLDDPSENKMLKVGVRNRGCSGLAYHLEWVEKAGSFDEEVVQDGVSVLVDSKALFSIIGSEMDWVEDKLSARFVFRNPNIKEECGCGESFMV